MPDHREASRAAPAGRGDPWSRAEIDAAIAGLSRARRSITQALGGIRPIEEAPPQPGLGVRAAIDPAPPPAVGGAEPEAGESPGAAAGPPPIGESGDRPAAAPAAVGGPRGDDGPVGAAPEDPLEARIREAELEARAYLSRAKERADSLVNSMIGAVEREAADIRREAEEGIRERWRLAEAEAGRYVNEARAVADGMVHERQELIGSLSDGICTRAESLTEGMEDAEQIRAQFELFIRALSRTADQIAGGTLDRGHTPPTRLEAGRSPGGRSVLAA